MSAVIAVENLAKRYILTHQTCGQYMSLRDVISDSVGRMRRNILNVFSSQHEPDPALEEFWALKDVSFEVKIGDRIGIIGRNGSGKSTLLKILSRITEPTTGRVRIRGRVASLLEVGTGFHPELTGRENVFLNGAILGMTKAEIKRKFDEIIAFANIEKFLDTPVKRYSSGMYVRLAFAIAAHLEPEILIVDEVLAVGDAAFQKKCLGKMEDIGKEGRTVLFVSHNMQAVRNLCQKSIVLEDGQIVTCTDTEKAIKTYTKLLREVKIDVETGIYDETVRRGAGKIRFTSLEIQNEHGEKCSGLEMGKTIRFKISYKTFADMSGLAIYIALRSALTREVVTTAFHVITSEKISAMTEGTVTVEFIDTYIRPGDYPLYFQVSDAGMTQGNFEVLDDITAPLSIVASEGQQQHSNFDSSRPIGCFSLPSRVILNDIKKKGCAAAQANFEKGGAPPRTGKR